LLSIHRSAADVFLHALQNERRIMRALVRAGGPAWIAGLRTGDIVDKVDGRYWWEYGTYQRSCAPTTANRTPSM